ncbi:hypothetical protein [Streptomyces sp. NPDC020951]
MPKSYLWHGTHVLRTLDDALTLRLTLGRRLVVVGAGFLGAEGRQSNR